MAREVMRNSSGEPMCRDCCWGDRCDNPSHRYRPECSTCKGTGVISEEQVMTTPEPRDEAPRWRHRDGWLWLDDVIVAAMPAPNTQVVDTLNAGERAREIEGEAVDTAEHLEEYDYASVHRYKKRGGGSRRRESTRE